MFAMFTPFETWGNSPSIFAGGVSPSLSGGRATKKKLEFNGCFWLPRKVVGDIYIYIFIYLYYKNLFIFI